MRDYLHDDYSVSERERLSGLALFTVTNIRKAGVYSQDFFAKDECYTINEFNTILENHTYTDIIIKRDYNSSNSIDVIVTFDDQSAPLKNNRTISSFSDNLYSDFKVGDNHELHGIRLFCVCAKVKEEATERYYGDRAMYSLEEINHILRKHQAEVLAIEPVFKTGTEAFVLIRFNDKKADVTNTKNTQTPSSPGKKTSVADDDYSLLGFFRGFFKYIIDLITGKEKLFEKQEVKKKSSYCHSYDEGARYGGGFDITDNPTIFDKKVFRGYRIHYILKKQKQLVNMYFYSECDCLSIKEYRHVLSKHSNIPNKHQQTYNAIYRCPDDRTCEALFVVDYFTDNLKSPKQ